MRIALFTETFLPKVDGVVNTLCHLLDHLALRGHQSMLFAPAGGPSRYADTEVVGLPRVRMPGYPELRLALPLLSIDHHLSDFRPDLIHLVNPFSLGPAGLRFARRTGTPTIASYHTDIPGFLRRWHLGVFSPAVNAYLRALHNRADLNLTPSRETLNMLEGMGFRRLQVWERGVDTVLFRPENRSPVWRRRLCGGEPERPLLLYVGRLSYEKRVDWLRPVLEVLPRVRLAVVGDGPARASLERVFEGTPTVFTGYLQGEELAGVYASADIFTFASQYETVGNVILEAMASGLPVAAPRSGGLLDHVVHEKNGLLFDPDDPRGLSSPVRRLVENPAYGSLLGAAGRRYVEGRDWKSTLDGLLRAYTLVAAQSPGRRPQRPRRLDRQRQGTLDEILLQ